MYRYFDFKNAFDSVPHEALLYKLWSLGITGPSWKLFRDYFSNRKYFVSIDHSSSSCLPVISGVPQGSMLGPLLLLVYVKDNICKSSLYLFADDTEICKILNNPRDSTELQHDGDSLHSWYLEWKMSLHSGKCVVVHFGFSSHNATLYFVNGTPIQSTSKHRDFGIILSNNLYWSNHYLLQCLQISALYSPFFLLNPTC